VADATPTLVGGASLSAVQFTKSPLSTFEVARLGAVGELPASKADEASVAYFRSCGFPVSWARTALKLAHGNPALASDYVLVEEKNLKAADAREARKKSAQVIARAGFTVASCESALTSVDQSDEADVAKALGWLLHNASASTAPPADGAAERAWRESLFQVSARDNKPEASAQSSLSLVEEAPASGSAAPSAANASATPNAADAKSGAGGVPARPAPKRVTEFLPLPRAPAKPDPTHPDFDKLKNQPRRLDKEAMQKFNVARQAFVATRAATEQALSLAYARQCVLLLLQNSNSVADRAKLIGKLQSSSPQFIVKFLRLVEFTNVPNGLALLQTSLSKIVVEEVRLSPTTQLTIRLCRSVSLTLFVCDL
jgi:hypothetical protein